MLSKIIFYSYGDYIWLSLVLLQFFWRFNEIQKCFFKKIFMDNILFQIV